MANSRIEFALGSISFGGEGEAEWVEKQADAFLAKVPELIQLSKDLRPDKADNGRLGTSDGDITLAGFLKSNSSTANQTRKFLATAEWLHLRGDERVATSAVVKALRESRQGALGNPSDCLNKNVAKGFCEKVGGEFFVTPEGRTALGG